MLPFYYLAYRGKDVKTAMYFKSCVHQFSAEDYKKFYSNLDSISRNRLTDLNQQSINFIVSEMENSIRRIIDIGCSSGYLLKHLQVLYPDRYYTGCDIIDKSEELPYNYIQSDIQQLAIEDKSYDLVTCCHTLEHIVELRQAVRELVRICRKKLVIVVPCQRYYYYTLDEHINFFTHKYQLQALMDIDPERIEKCEKLWGDWVIVVNCEK